MKVLLHNGPVPLKATLSGVVILSSGLGLALGFITWAGKKTTDENGSVWQGTYKFNKNGTYTRTNIEIDKQGNKKEANIYGQWSFGDPSFSTIYFGGEHYWDIDELTKNKFSFYDRSGKFGDPFMNREYIELTPYQENNTTN